MITATVCTGVKEASDRRGVLENIYRRKKGVPHRIGTRILCPRWWCRRLCIPGERNRTRDAHHPWTALAEIRTHPVNEQYKRAGREREREKKRDERDGVKQYQLEQTFDVLDNNH